jgi:hypothetical protein
MLPEASLSIETAEIGRDSRRMAARREYVVLALVADLDRDSVWALVPESG